MPVFPVFLNQLLLAMTVGTVLTTFALLPACVRESRFQRIILLLIVLSTGEVSAWLFHNFWFIFAVLALPLLVSLIESMWSPWACINGVCLLQNVLVFLLAAAYTALHHSDPLSSLCNRIIWGVQIVSVLVTLAATFDVLTVLGRRSFPERDYMLNVPEPDHWPGICIQVPAYNEPPELLTQTITHLIAQDYPGRWMIQIIDNNTPDPNTWLPVQAFCQRLGDRVQFIHLDDWPGFKSGALNEGTRRLPAWVDVVAVADADYLVEPHFLRATARHFSDPEVAFVQTPQHYREWQGSPYLEGLNYMYESFFAISMVSRRELNSIVCFGSMCLVRRRSLEMIGGWDEESITEDVELSVRLLSHGWRSVYDHRCYGAGLMPFDFGSLKKQRFRWAFGMIQVLKKHWSLMLGLPAPGGRRLSLKQRLCFYGLGLQYLAEVPPFIFALLQIISVLAYSLGWKMSAPALAVAVIGPLLLLVIAGVRMIWALREVTNCTRSQALGAFIFSLALSWITARACISACLHRKGVFLRTPKTHNQQKWQQALRITCQEGALSLSFLVVALFSAWRASALLPLAVLISLQACIYSQSVLCALAAEGIWLLPRSFFGTRPKNENRQQSEQDQFIEMEALLPDSVQPAIRSGVVTLKRSSLWRQRRACATRKLYYF